MYYRLLHVPGCEEGAELAEDLMEATKVVFAESGLPKIFVSDAGTNIVHNDLKNSPGA